VSSGEACNASSGLPRTPRPEPLRRRLRESPRIVEPLAVPAMALRVAPNRASFSAIGFAKLWVAPLPHASATPAMKASGCPSSRISGFAGDGSPSCLESRILRRCRLAGLRVAPHVGLSVSPTIRFPSRPGSRIFRPRLVVRPGRPGPRTLRLCQRGISGSPRIFWSSGGADRPNLQVALSNRSLGVADGLISGLPRIPVLRRCRRCFFELPRIGVYNWVDDESPAVLELCIISLRRG